MGALIPLALSIAPDLAKYLAGNNAEKTSAAVSEAVKSATGTYDVDTATAKLQQDPAAAAQLRIQLARITTECDMADVRAQMMTAAAPKANMAWSAPAISIVVLLTFGAVMGTILVKGMPAGAETAANMLLGTLAAMATSVVSYWVGSSAGSARKDDRLAQSGR